MFLATSFKVHILIAIAILVVILANSLYLILFKKVKKSVRGLIFTVIYALLVVALFMTKDTKVDPFIKSSVFSNVILISSMVYGLIPSLFSYLIFIPYFFVTSYHYLIMIQLMTVVIVTTIRLFMIDKKYFNSSVYSKIIVTYLINIISLSIFIVNYKTFRFNVSTYLVFLLTLPISSLLSLLFVDNQVRTVKEIDIVNDEYDLLKHSLNSTQAIQVIILDKNLKYLETNDVHKNIMKKFYNADINVGSKYTDYINTEKNKKEILDKINLAFKGINEELTYYTSKGQALKTFFSGITNDHNEIDTIVLFTQDITENKRKEAAIQNLTYRDSLTNVYNRRYFMDKLDKFKKIEELIIIYIDVNMLKFINDAFGHSYGDKLLEIVASKAIKHFGVDAKVIRMGGDEFIILIEGMNVEEATRSLDNFIASNKSEIIIATSISISAGLALKEKDQTFEQAFKEAEEKMYKNKLLTNEKRITNFIESINNHLVKEEIVSLELIEAKKYYGKLILDKLNIREKNQLLESLIDNFQVGKISIAKEILTNNNRNKIERKEYVTYIDLSYRILAAVPRYKDISELVLFVEENYDGSGYPDGLKVESIPILSQILNLLNFSDNYLLNDQDELIKLLPSIANRRVDGSLVELFLEILEEER